MASEKQIAANRANAQRSTGPKTAAGKRNSSRNAFRHGLSVPALPDPATADKIDAIALAVAGEGARAHSASSANDFARAQLQLLRIRSVRAELLSEIDLNNTNIRQLRRLAALDRYERYAFTKRGRAALKI